MNEVVDSLLENDLLFEQIGTDFQMVAQEIEEFEQQKHQICLCGHQVSKHYEVAGRKSCATSKVWCPCERTIPALKVSDARYFQRATSGIGSLHALQMGLFHTRRNKKPAEWLIELSCFKCSTIGVRLLACSYTEDKRIVRRASKFNGLFCMDCIIEIQSLSG
jgi:hypothetical protein